MTNSAAPGAERAPRHSDLYIETAEGLSALAKQLDHAPWLAIDTEFLREKTYRARLCLIQIAAPGVVACIDPIALPRLEALCPLFSNRKITKILHAAHQDLEILLQSLGEVPAPVFDTQVAAALLGQGEQIGYGKLVANLLGIALEKGHARTDWSKRPLDPAQIHYAADDVRYLGELYSRQHAELATLGRLDWLDEESRKLNNADNYSPKPDEAWQRLKGVQNLQGAALPVVQTLAAWRERQAMTQDRPRKWILPDETLLEIAQSPPSTTEELLRIRTLPEKIARRHANAILQCIQKGQTMPESTWPKMEERLMLDTEQEEMLSRLMSRLRQEAQRQNIAPPLLATRRELERLVRGDNDLPMFKGWRAKAIGHALMAEMGQGLCGSPNA